MSGTGRLGVHIERHEALGSTNERALELAGAGAPEGTVVLARTQTRGRGRMGRTWQDAPGSSLLMSVLLRPSVAPRMLPLLALAAGTATAEAVREVSGVEAWTKWPNDIVAWAAEGVPAKLGGVLVEGQRGCAVVGIGVNVGGTPAALGEGAVRAVSIAEMGGSVVSVDELLGHTLAGLEPLYAALEGGDVAGLLACHRALDMTTGQAVTFARGDVRRQGVAMGIGESGELWVLTGEGPVAITSGEVSVRINCQGGEH